MKKAALLFFTVIMAFSLGACSKNGMSPDEYANALKELYSGVSDFDLTADITGDYGDYIYGCSVKYSGGSDYGLEKVLSPDEIKGLEITLIDGGSSVMFDGTELYMGKLGKTDISPVSSLPLIIDCWQNGYVEQAAFEPVDGADTLMAVYPVSGETYIASWFDLSSNYPLKAEISSEGRTVITCVFRDVNINES